MERLEPVFSSNQVSERVAAVAREISERYRGASGSVVFVCVLKGAFVFFADLIREVDFDAEIEFVRLASYGAGTAPSQVTFSRDVETLLQDKHVILVEDIVDTGQTVGFLERAFRAREPASISVCTLIHKLERREEGSDPDFTCFTVNSGFLVGCGLDYAERYRGLDGVYEVVFSEESG